MRVLGERKGEKEIGECCMTDNDDDTDEYRASIYISYREYSTTYSYQVILL